MNSEDPYNSKQEPGCDYMAEFGKRCGHLDSAHHDGERYCADCADEMNAGLRGFDALCDNGPVYNIPGKPARSLIEIQAQRAAR